MFKNKSVCEPKMSSESDYASCTNISCIQGQSTVQHFAEQNLILNKLIHHLEDEIVLQKDYISLLKNTHRIDDNKTKDTFSRPKHRTIKPNLTILPDDTISVSGTEDLLLDKTIASNCKFDNAATLSAPELHPNTSGKLVTKTSQKHQRTVSENGILDSKQNENRNKNKMPLIRGSGQKTNIFQIAERRGFIFATGFATATTEDMIKTFLNQHVSCDFVIEKITSKSKTVSSFKIGMPLSLKGELMKENVWPEGIIINHFFRKRTVQ
ncbi:hypothetical protein FQR65_LT02843 [Abscondita terminalis]|nr:hypothetical protein FQR65_LT02843 [Abscondita terminalis]